MVGSDGKDQNTWQGSEVQKWLNSSHEVPVKLRSTGNVTVKGFLHPEYFTEWERAVMAPYGDGTDGKVTLPSGEADTSAGIFQIAQWPQKGELVEWFGVQNERIRRASFKGAVFNYNTTDRFWAYYWTRTPFIDGKYSTWNVMKDSGFLIYHGTQDSVVGVRPVCVVNLSSVLFKVPVSLVWDAKDSPGSMENPWLLYTGGEIQPAGICLDSDVIKLSFDVEIAPVGRWPDKSDFIISNVSQSINITHVTSTDESPKVLLLKLEEPVSFGESLTLTYNISMDKTGTLSVNSGAVCSGDSSIAMKDFVLGIEY